MLAVRASAIARLIQTWMEARLSPDVPADLPTPIAVVVTAVEREREREHGVRWFTCLAVKWCEVNVNVILV